MRRGEAVSRSAHNGARNQGVMGRNGEAGSTVPRLVTSLKRCTPSPHRVGVYEVQQGLLDHTEHEILLPSRLGVQQTWGHPICDTVKEKEELGESNVGLSPRVPMNGAQEKVLPPLPQPP